MVIEAFPDIHYADKSGLLAIGGDLELESLLLAYRSGIFPWPLPDGTLAWFAPPKRAILRLSEFHVGRSLRKQLATSKLQVTFNQNFPAVIRGCQQSKHRKGQGGTWITSYMLRAYERLFRAGFAFSVEASLNGAIVGGLYGVSIGHNIAGESMFYLAPNASKIALCHFVDRLRMLSIEWIDCQVMTPLFRSFGATEVNREDFMILLNKAISKDQIVL